MAERLNIMKHIVVHRCYEHIDSCYCVSEQSEAECCNSCDEIRETYRRRGWGLMNPDLIEQCKREGFVQRIKAEEGEGFNVYGSLEVNNVAGNFHFVKSFHLANMHVPLADSTQAFREDSYNTSHKINKLSFGDHPGIVNPLDGLCQLCTLLLEARLFDQISSL